MRLIDLDALIVAWCDGCEAPEKGMCNDDMCEFAEIVKKFPTIDAVTVEKCKECNQYNEGFNDGIRVALSWQVLCKDCLYWDEAKVNEKGFLICPASGMEITDNDFCSYGERRSDGR